MIITNEILALLAEDIPAMEADSEGKLRGGFSAFGDGGSMNLLGNEGCNNGCSVNENCDNCGCENNVKCNDRCTVNSNCGGKCTPKSEPGTGENKPDPTTTPKPNVAFMGFGSSFLF